MKKRFNLYIPLLLAALIICLSACNTKLSENEEIGGEANESAISIISPYSGDGVVSDTPKPYNVITVEFPTDKKIKCDTPIAVRVGIGAARKMHDVGEFSVTAEGFEISNAYGERENDGLTHIYDGFNQSPFCDTATDFTTVDITETVYLKYTGEEKSGPLAKVGFGILSYSSLELYPPIEIDATSVKLYYATDGEYIVFSKNSPTEARNALKSGELSRYTPPEESPKPAIPSDRITEKPALPPDTARRKEISSEGGIISAYIELESSRRIPYKDCFAVSFGIGELIDRGDYEVSVYFGCERVLDENGEELEDLTLTFNSIKEAREALASKTVYFAKGIKTPDLFDTPQLGNDGSHQSSLQIAARDKESGEIIDIVHFDLWCVYYGDYMALSLSSYNDAKNALFDYSLYR